LPRGTTLVPETQRLHSMAPKKVTSCCTAAGCCAAGCCTAAGCCAAGRCARPWGSARPLASCPPAAPSAAPPAPVAAASAAAAPPSSCCCCSCSAAGTLRPSCACSPSRESATEMGLPGVLSTRSPCLSATRSSAATSSGTSASLSARARRQPLAPQCSSVARRSRCAARRPAAATAAVRAAGTHPCRPPPSPFLSQQQPGLCGAAALFPAHTSSAAPPPLQQGLSPALLGSRGTRAGPSRANGGSDRHTAQRSAS
jgi:hypothetical protein